MNTHETVPPSQDSYGSVPTSPTYHRHRSRRSRPPSISEAPDENTALLRPSRSRVRIHSPLETPRGYLSRAHSFAATPHGARYHNRHESWGQRLIQALSDRTDPMSESKSSLLADERIWYDQFTSTDWVHDSIADAYRVKQLRSRKGFWGRIVVLFDGAQGWILSAVVGVLVAVVAYCVDVAETTIFDYKDGFCARAWYLREKRCCPHGPCTDWRSWSEVLGGHPFGEVWTEFGVYIIAVLLLAVLSCLLTLTTKTVVPSAYRMSTLDENLAADYSQQPEDNNNDNDESGSISPRAVRQTQADPPPPMVYYSAAGSGVAEVRVILSGFVLHGFLGFKTLIIKSAGLILSVASGLSLGKEGPYVHIATCIGNICCRLFSKYDHNDGKRREVLSAAAAAGVVVAFGAPLGGVLFGLEEVAYYFPAKTLFRTFFCCIIAALTLKFLNPYGTHKIVMFEIRYKIDWEWFELFGFILVGILGGAIGALFIKASRRWALSFRKIPVIKKYPLFEVVLVALVTGLIGYWNTLTKLPVAKLLLNLAAPCQDDSRDSELGLCPSNIDEIPGIIRNILAAFIIKTFLTTITFGIKVPAGIYVPSMVVGGLMGRVVGHLVQWIVLRFPHWGIWGTCPLLQESTCVQPGVYALIAAGSTMCGVTRLSVTLAVILFELTGSLDYVLPFSLAILVAKWTADALEPLSIYDLLTNMNAYPYLDNKHKPVFTSEFADIVPRVRRERVIDISDSPLVPATQLRGQLELLHRGGELDGGLPIVRDDVLVGLIPAPDLEYALDSLEDESSSFCLMANIPNVDEDESPERDPTDFTPYIDPAPFALDINSPMDLVYECFAKLGLRYICALRNGCYAGMTHKKRFVKYMRELEEKEHNH
ncbi:H(+)/Cl(-) exchange transporter 3 [Daldinia childiae]|uniref:H(+)/Cl(-) exchange transporter 3 n=2 Tax=Daldinia childiae TaxID=326645 RepID=UPI001444FE2B|nr:H(+)/Cl(-) exchange transporter 3 [Daldinia childiae]KAF3059378.1 H(+)/Cl(-) exchange transporter 3 [Daldinia childiae]